MTTGSKMTWFFLFLFCHVHEITESSSARNGSIPAPKRLNDTMMGCERGWYSFNNKCYKRGTWKRNWRDASSDCREVGGDLVVIQNQETQDFVQFMLLDLQQSLWIGLQVRHNESYYAWIDGSTVNYTNWRPGEPSGNTYEECTEMVFMVTNGEYGQWNDVQCYTKLHYVCQKDQTEYLTTNAPLDPIFCSEENKAGLKFRRSCYNLVTEKKSWWDAEDYCSRRYSGHLVSIRDFSVDLFLSKILKTFNEEIWIGIHLKEGFTQEWSNGFFVRYNGWAESRRPIVLNGRCVTRIQTRLWNVSICSEKLPFICEKTSDVPASRPQTAKGYVCPSEPDDWSDLGGNRCYFFETEKKVSWDEANAICMSRGGNLVSIHSSAESRVLQELIIHTQHTLHIGLQRQPQGRKRFSWSDKSELDFINWGPGEPNPYDENCTEVYTFTMKWNDIFCDRERGYICSVMKIAPKGITTTEVTDVERFSQEDCLVVPTLSSTTTSAPPEKFIGGTPKIIDGASPLTWTGICICVFCIGTLLGYVVCRYFKSFPRRRVTQRANARTTCNEYDNPMMYGDPATKCRVQKDPDYHYPTMDPKHSTSTLADAASDVYEAVDDTVDDTSSV